MPGMTLAQSKQSAVVRLSGEPFERSACLSDPGDHALPQVGLQANRVSLSQRRASMRKKALAKIIIRVHLWVKGNDSGQTTYLPGVTGLLLLLI